MAKRRISTDWNKPAHNARLSAKVLYSIQRRRRQLLVHSCLYYRLDHPLISDHKWTEWAQQLKRWQDKHGWEIGFYDEQFQDWDGSTGHHLRYDEDIIRVAGRLLEHHQRQELLS